MSDGDNAKGGPSSRGAGGVAFSEATDWSVVGRGDADERWAQAFVDKLRKRYAGEDKTVLVRRVALDRLSADAAPLLIRYLLELHTERLGLDVAAYPGPQNATSAVRAAVAAEGEAIAKLADAAFERLKDEDEMGEVSTIAVEMQMLGRAIRARAHAQPG